MGVSPLHQVLRDWTAGLDLQGDLFDLPGGAMTVAAGVSYRKTSVRGETDAIGAAGGYFAANYVPTRGGYNVKEAYVEANLPLARDVAWADSLVIDAAARATDYSTAGYVTTWKVGGTWRLNPIGLRANLSRDIRAPSLGELFTPGATGFTTVVDPVFGTQVVPRYLQTGNPDLKAEKATSWGVGAIFTPSFIPGLTASVDYFNIKIEDAIASVSNQQIVDRCFNGAESFCSLVERDANRNLVRILTSPVNFQQLRESGLDFELGYQMPIGANGTISLRAFATHIIRYEQRDGITRLINAAGSISAPSWRWFSTLTYKNPQFTASIVNRGLNATNYNTTAFEYTECTSGCPLSTSTSRTINTNRIAGANYVDLNLAFHIESFGGRFEPYISVQNVFNKDPSINPGTLFQGRAAVSNQFDLLGRVFRVGLRFDF
jgi:outer membrane receptor protein involved in Fe transport